MSVLHQSSTQSMLNQQLDSIRTHKAKLKKSDGLINAAVAVILRDTVNGPEFFMIQRAYHPNDQWSGQMAFPGGKYDAQDQSLKTTAIRETYEEVGLQLNDDEFIGQVDDVYGINANRSLSVHITSFVFKLERNVELIANYEVADMLWLPFSILENPDNSHEFYHPHDTSIKMPAVLLNKEKSQIIWGLSLRILFILFGILNRPMNVLSAQEKDYFTEIESINK